MEARRMNRTLCLWIDDTNEITRADELVGMSLDEARERLRKSPRFVAAERAGRVDERENGSNLLLIVTAG
jgi:hypothetical protein